jgi:hypothetical protein
VLDTSIRIGTKLFVWNIPLTQSVALIPSTSSRASTAMSGRGRAGAHHLLELRLRGLALRRGGEPITIPATGESAGEGFLIPTFFNIGGPQNITVQVDLGSLRLMLPFPYGMRGFELGENNLYGSIIGAIRARWTCRAARD